MPDLGSCFARYGALKPPAYVPVYEELLAPAREGPLRLLELGVLSGGSILGWRDYLPAAEVTGLDLCLPERVLGVDRVRCYAGAQDDAGLLARVAAERGPFDLVVDDCSHLGALAEASYRALWPHVVPAGAYVVEDWATGYWPDWQDGAAFERGHSAGMVGFVKAIVDDAGRGLDGIDRVEVREHIVVVRRAR